MPYLNGESGDTYRFFREWIIPTAGGAPAFDQQVGGATPNETNVTFKANPGSYDLVSVITAGYTAAWESGIISGALTDIARKIKQGLGFHISQTDTDHALLVEESETFFESYYDTPTESSIGSALIFDPVGLVLAGNTYNVGTLQDDSAQDALEMLGLGGALHAGLGNDLVKLVEAPMTGTNFAFGKLLDGGDGTDRLDYRDLSIVFADQSSDGLQVVIEEVDGAYAWRALLDLLVSESEISDNLAYGFEELVLSPYDDTVRVSADLEVLTGGLEGRLESPLQLIDGGDELETGDLLDFSALPEEASGGSLELSISQGGSISGSGWTLNTTGFERLVGSAYGDTIHAGGDFTHIDGGFGNDLMFTNGSTAEIGGGVRSDDLEALADALRIDQAELLQLPDNDIVVDNDGEQSRFVFTENGGHDVILTNFEDGEIVFEGLSLSDLTVTVAGEDVYGGGDFLIVDSIAFEVNATGASLVVTGGVSAHFYRVSGTSDYELASENYEFAFTFGQGGSLGVEEIMAARGGETLWSQFRTSPGEKYADIELEIYQDVRIQDLQISSDLDPRYFSAFGASTSEGGLPVPQEPPALLAAGPDAVHSTPTQLAGSTGTAEQDVIGGTRASEAIYGGAGDDLIFGDEGDDDIHGGDGFDAAFYAGSIDDYDVVQVLDSQGKVIGFASATDTNPTDGDEGTDTLRGIERLEFADGSLEIDPSVKFNTLTVRAGGIGTLAVAPMFEVIADGVSLGVRSLTAPIAGTFDPQDDDLFQEYVFQFGGGRPEMVELVYFNDLSGDPATRSLWVNHVDINGTVFEAEVDGLFTPEAGGPATATEELADDGTLALSNLTYANSVPELIPLDDVVMNKGGTFATLITATDVDADPLDLFVELIDASTGLAVDSSAYSFTDNGDGTGDFAFNTSLVSGTRYSATVTVQDGADRQSDSFTIEMHLAGTSGDDVITGLATDDTIIAGLGDDILRGGLGSDRYTYALGDGADVIEEVESLTDRDRMILGTGVSPDSIILERSGSNLDNLLLSFSAGGSVEIVDQFLSTRKGVEFIEFDDGTVWNEQQIRSAYLQQSSATAAVVIEGFAGADQIRGGSGDDVLLGAAGRDTIYGGQGNDELSGDADGDYLNGGDGSDILFGGDGDDTLKGGAGDDILHGGEGLDSFDGGTGTDTVDFSDATEDLTISLSVGTASNGIIIEPVVNIENILAGSGDDSVTGGFGDNVLAGGGGDDLLIGGAGNDTLDGGAGSDAMAGGTGNDIYIVDAAGDGVTEAAGEGTDEVRTTLASYTLGANVENLAYTGSAGFSGTGNALANTVTGGADNDTLVGGGGADTLNGGAGNDTLDGGAGSDAMVGGIGNDIYVVDAAGDVLIEAAGQGTDEVRTTLASYTLGADLESLTYTGSTAFAGTGNALGNTITGGAGNDTLNGGAGADSLIGGTGNDTYTVDGADDVVTEASDEGTDEVRTALASYTLGSNIEKLTYTGASAFTGTGNTLANTIAGGAGNDILDGGAGTDTLIGGTGNDTYTVDASGDVVTEAASAGTDEVRTALASYALGSNLEKLTYTGSSAFTGTGNTLANTITGGAGNDILDGGTGTDTLIGGSGNDTYTVDVAGDLITEAASAGTDEVRTVLASYTLGAELEKLTYTGASAFTGTGNGLANTITGGNGNDTLNGGAGIDTLIGGAGNDTYTVDVSGDVVTEAAGAGTDEVRTALASYALGSNLEKLTYTGSSAFTGTGNTLANTITGGTGNDTLDGGTGSDTLIGGTGNDTYIVDVSGDVVTEAASAGTDEVRTALASYTLGSNIEKLTYTGASAFTGNGNTLANTIIGGAGSDTLNGAAGIDSLTGAGGKDTLSGGADGDTFIFGSGSSGITAATADTISDWTTADSIDMAIAGSASNYSELATTATTISAAATFAESQVTNTAIAHVFLFNASSDIGFLLSDLNNDDAFETGIILTGAGAAADFAFADLV